MENERKRIYPSQQLVCALPPTVLKTYMYLLGWQSQETIKIFVRQIAKATKMNETEVELAIQTLEDVKLIDISIIDQTYCVTLNGEQAQKYFNVPMSKIMESEGIKVSKTVTWKQEQNKASQEPKIDVSDLSETDLKRLLLRIEASLSEKQQLKKVVVSSEPKEVEIDDLPF